MSESKKAAPLDNQKTLPEIAEKVKEHEELYLTIVSYTGGQIDNTLTKAVVITPEQFIYAYEEADKGFVFMESDEKYNTPFTFSNISAKTQQGTAESCIDAIYNLPDLGYGDAEGNPDLSRFLRILTGKQVDVASAADPRMVMH